MTDRIMGLMGIATLAGFLGILFWKVPRLDLGIVIAIVLALVLWDFFANAQKKGPNGG